MANHSELPALNALHGNRPVCWYWDIEGIKDYVRTRYPIARTRFINEDPVDGGRPTHFDNLINNVLYPCLKNTSTYSYEPSTKHNKEIHVEYVPFHLRKGEGNVPIADVYTALGWFISYAEKPTQTTQASQERLACYSRLCYIIGDACLRHKNPRIKQDQFFPTKTHFLYVKQVPLLTADPDTRNTHKTPVGVPDIFASYSASLPNENKFLTRAKQFLKRLREDLIFIFAGQEVVNRMKDLKDEHVGICAETLNYLSQYCRDTRVIGCGEAMTVAEFAGDFTSFPEIIRRAHCEACQACRELFRSGNVTEADIGSGSLNGELPPTTHLPKYWAERKFSRCNYCNQAYKRPYKDSFCSPECFRKYSTHCHQSNGCWPRQAQPINNYASRNVTHPDGQTYIPAAVGYPRDLKFFPASQPGGYMPATINQEFYGHPERKFGGNA